MGKWLGIADETVFGTPVTPPTEFLDCQSIDLHPERESAEVESSNFIGPTSAATGSYKILGETEIIPNSENILKLLKYLLGAPTTSQDGTDPRYKHQFWPLDTLKFATLYKVDEQLPDGVNALQYTSVIATELRLEAALNAFVSTRFSLFGQKDAKITKPTIGTFSAVKQFFSMNGKMYWDITGTLEETLISAMSLTYTREIPDDFYSMNDAFLKGFIPGAAKLEGSVDLLFKDWTAYEKFWGGTSAPISSPARAAMSFDFIGPALTGGSGEYEFNRLKALLPSLILPSVKEPFEGRGKVVQTVEFKADRGSVGGQTALWEVDLVNAIASA